MHIFKSFAMARVSDTTQPKPILNGRGVAAFASWFGPLPALWACVLLSIPSLGTATTLQLGDVLTPAPNVQQIGGPVPGDIFLVRGQSYQSLIHFIDDPAVAVAIDPSNHIYALRSYVIEIYDSSGVLLRTINSVPLATSAVFDAAGNLFVAAGHELAMFDSKGSLVRTFTMSTAVFGGIDLGADQCTMYFVAGRTIGRFDICTNARLADVAVLPPVSYGNLRVLADGSLLVAGRPNTLHISLAGATLRAYSIPADAVAVTPGGRSFWAGPGLTLADIQNGTTLSQVPAPSPTYSLAVVGEPRAALASASVPALSTQFLLLLAAVLGLAGLRLTRSA